MGIEIITDKIKLTKDQESTLMKFIDNNCSYYYFLNFIKITTGDVEKAIELYNFDEELRIILIKYILRFEIQLKKDFIECVENSTNDFSFWNKDIYYKKAFTKHNKGNNSSFDVLTSDISLRMTKMRYTSSGPNDNRALYPCSFGTFRKMYTGLQFVYHRDFTESYIYPDRYSFNKMNSYLCCIQAIRNRCCHSNHIVSPKLNYYISKYTLDNLGYSCFKSNLSKTVNFIHLKLKNNDGMKNDLLRVLSKYENIWIKYVGRHAIDKDLIESINNNW